MMHPNDPDQRCARCESNLDNYAHMWEAPCPETGPFDDPICAACCASSDSDCIDCASIPVLPPPTRSTGTAHTLPPNPLGVSNTSDAAATDPSTITRSVGSESVAAASSPLQEGAS